MISKVGLISLGCSKNRVDSEQLLGFLRAQGFTVTPNEAEAGVIIVNTCGFITPAKEESINTILEMARYKDAGSCKLLVVTGCLSQRYKDELMPELPEVDLFWGVRDYAALAKELANRCGVSPTAACGSERVLTTPSYSAYLRIADGCDNNCTYCAIPLIRGKRSSVPVEQLIDEANALADRGVVELTLIAQDTSAYGLDLYGKPRLAELLRSLARIEKLRWIRLLYTYPNTVDEELIDTMLAEPKIANYIDMPIQHIAEGVLLRMNRHGSAAHIRDITAYIRKKDPDFILRTTVLVGFPGETEVDFAELTGFIRAYPFDRLGAFAYSQEDGTPAAEFTGQLNEETKQARLDAIMRIQRDISLEFNKKRVGKTYEVIVERVEGEYAYGRSYAEAPEVDGHIRFLRKRELTPGEFCQVKITGAGHYDLWGEEI
jgi:ribosomal protein S12 methylthiotransferase